VIDRHLTSLNNSTIVKTLLWHNEQATAGFAQQLAALLIDQPSGLNACITLDGELGAGKTTFVRHLLQALGVSGRIKSPTYAVVEPYEVDAGPIWHFDFYRFTNPQEWEDAGFRDIFAGSGLKLCEWPAHAQGMLPKPDIAMRISVDEEEQRKVTFESHTAVGATWLSRLEPES
jgi:tRNA threonylcarbamoyladenosine biosynthesis protein TsaE